MPCSDLSELLTLHLDRLGCIVDYSLTKASCGAPLGRALLLPVLSGRALESLLALPAPPTLPDDSLGAFLAHKEWSALCAAAAAYLGLEPCGPRTPFALISVEAGDDGTAIQGMLVVAHIDPAQVAPCQSCAQVSG